MTPEEEREAKIAGTMLAIVVLIPLLAFGLCIYKAIAAPDGKAYAPSDWQRR